MWDMTTFKCIHIIINQKTPIKDASLSFDNRCIVLCGGGYVIKSFEFKHNKMNVYCDHSLSYFGHQNEQDVNCYISNDVTCLDISPNNDNLIVSCSENITCHLTDYHGNCLNEYKGHVKRILCVRFFADGKRFVTCSKDKTIKLWNIDKSNPIMSFEGHADSVLKIDISFDETQLLSTSRDGVINVWDIESGNIIQTYHVNKDIRSSMFLHKRRYPKPAKIDRYNVSDNVNDNNMNDNNVSDNNVSDNNDDS